MRNTCQPASLPSGLPRFATEMLNRSQVKNELEDRHYENGNSQEHVKSV
jgi:hypothetical protein